MAAVGPSNFDCLEIKTRSIEQTLLPLIKQIHFKHTHFINVAEAYSYLRMTEEVKTNFVQYFENGLSAGEAKNLHETNLMADIPDEEELVRTLANSHVNPTSRQIYHLFEKWREENYGNGGNILSIVDKIKEKIPALEENGCIIRLEEDPFSLIIITPIMQRAHTTKQSEEICFIDSTGSCDQQNASITFLLTATTFGAVPLACCIHSAQDERSYTKIFQMVIDSLNGKAFNEKGAPAVIITDDSNAERNALRTVFKNSKLFLCIFHFMQYVWRWLWDSKNSIRIEHRPVLINMIKNVLYCNDKNSCETEYNLLLEHPVAKMYKHFLNYMDLKWSKRSEWCLCYRKDFYTRGHNTNNFAEAGMRIFKDVVLNRWKAYNSVSLLLFITDKLEKYHKRRFLEISNFRNRRLHWQYINFFKKSKILNVIEVDNITYSVASSKDDSINYTVNISKESCSCMDGLSGKFCKHLFAVHINYGYKFTYMPQLSVQDRITAAKLAIGNNIDETFFNNMLEVNEAHSSTSIVHNETEVNKTETLFEVMPEKDKNFKEDISLLKNNLQRIIDIAEQGENDIDFQQIIKKFNNAVKEVNTPTDVKSLMAQCTKIKRRKKIQISSLVETAGSLRASAVARVGQAVNVAVDRFVTVGETIADDYVEVRQGMYEACKEARQAGSAIERICEEVEDEVVSDRTTLVRAARCLLGAITRVLLLADIVVVKQLLLAKDKVQRSLDKLESVNNFTEFVKAFSQFGAEMVELAHLTGDRQNDLKDERRRAQMAAARQVLERSTMMLLTSSKTTLRHPDSTTARENRDTVFCQMRRAMDLIHFVVKDGVLNSAEPCIPNQKDDIDTERGTFYSCMRNLQHLLELSRVTLDASCHETLSSALDAVLERTQDFTDSAYTSHEHRQVVLDSSDRLRGELDHLLGLFANVVGYEGAAANCPEMDSYVSATLNACKDLSRHLASAALQQAQEVATVTKQGQELVVSLRQQALQDEPDRLHHSSNAFHDSIDHILEVCKLLRHVAESESLQVSARFIEINLRVYGPQVITAAKTLAAYPGSKIAQENLEVFTDMYQWLVSDVTAIVKDVLDDSHVKPEKQVYMSLPRPGKHGTTSKPLKAVRLDSEEQAKIAKSGLEMKLATSEMDAETDKWQESSAALEENNDIVKRAKNMSSMAFSMYQFTKGEGDLKTTQDLFTQAEYFAEEANRLYKVIRQFSYQVPGGTNKKELLEHLDKVPTYVQRLQFSVKDHTVGKAATFTKVDNVIQETKNLMTVISKVVTTCFECATKYKLDFNSGCASGQGAGADGGASSGSGATGDFKAPGTGSDQSL